MGYMDIETKYGIYLVDGSLNTEACPVGTCDPFEESNVEQMRQGNYDFPANITNYEEYGWLCSAAASIYDEDGEIIGMTGVDVSMDEIMQNRPDFLYRIKRRVGKTSCSLLSPGLKSIQGTRLRISVNPSKKWRWKLMSILIT